MLRRLHHQQVAEALSMLDAPLLAEHNCWFGGGTAIVLDNGEFRESVDIDFLVSEQQSYRQLRQIVRVHGLDALATRELELGRTPSVDGYGIRTSVLVAGVAIKFEIIHEGRIDLDTPAPGDEICGLRVLTRTDQVATKLLANDDRWADTSTFSRDLIDLAMMAPARSVLVDAFAKAGAAYGEDVGRDLERSFARLRDRDGWLERCMRMLDMSMPVALAWQRLRDLGNKVANVQPGK